MRNTTTKRKKIVKKDKNGASKCWANMGKESKIALKKAFIIFEVIKSVFKNLFSKDLYAR